MIKRYIVFALLLVLICCQSMKGTKYMNIHNKRENIQNMSNYKKYDVANLCAQDLDNAKKMLVKLVSAPNANEKSLDDFNEIQRYISNAWAMASLMSNVHPDKKIRTDAERCEQQVSKFYTDLSLNKKVYNVLNSINSSKMDAQAKRMLTKTLQDFKRSGVDKDDKTREKIKQLNEQLTVISQDFGKNIREDVRYIELDDTNKLDGLPDDYVKSHKKNSNGKIKITTDYPDYIPFMTYAKDSGLRKKLSYEFLNRGFPKNEPVFQQMLEKRYELAKTLGYEDYASYVVEDKMIKTPVKVKSFIDEIIDISTKSANEEYELLKTTKKQLGNNDNVVYGYEKSYLEEIIKRDKYAFDSKKIRKYFQFDKVLNGLLDVTSKLYSIDFIPLVNEEVWHKSVKVYDVMENNTKLGTIYLDLHPRDNKYKHAAQFTLKDGYDGKQLPQGVLVCNFPSPDSSDIALMDHDQVVTFFHEFGHLMHHIFGGKQKWGRFSGVATEWDFVEAPSQLYEEWAWSWNVLKDFAIHIDTKQPIDQELVKKMRDADEFGKALRTKTQMFYASLSLNYYNQNPANIKPLELLVELQKKYSLFPYMDGTHFHLNFGHLDGYSAMYYTYMWSLVIAKDLLVEFEKQGLMNTQLASKYKETILKPGGSKDAEKLVHNFLGRPYNFNAFKKWLSKQGS